MCQTTPMEQGSNFKPEHLIDFVSTVLPALRSAQGSNSYNTSTASTAIILATPSIRQLCSRFPNKYATIFEN